MKYLLAKCKHILTSKHWTWKPVQEYKPGHQGSGDMILPDKGSTIIIQAWTQKEEGEYSEDPQ